MRNQTTIIQPFLPTGPQAVVTVLQHLGAIAIPVMSEADALYLSLEAGCLPYEERPKRYGKRKVRQDVASCELPRGYRLWEVADELEHQLSVFFGPGAFESPLNLSQRNVQRYKHGTFGIGRHRDESVNRNLVVLLCLRGEGEFVVYDGLRGGAKVRWELRPGYLLLMVAPGFYGLTEDDRPFHRVGQIIGDPFRYVMGLRQHVSIEVVRGGRICR